jgi:hypothetical protein
MTAYSIDTSKFLRRLRHVIETDSILTVDKFISKKYATDAWNKLCEGLIWGISIHPFDYISTEMYLWAITSNHYLAQFLAWHPYSIAYVMVHTKEEVDKYKIIWTLMQLNESLDVDRISIKTQLANAYYLTYLSSSSAKFFLFEYYYLNSPYRDMNFPVINMGFLFNATPTCVYLRSHGVTGLANYVMSNPGEIDFRMPHNGDMSLITYIIINGTDEQHKDCELLFKTIEQYSPGLISSLEF